VKRIILFVLCFFFLFCTFGCTQEEVEDTDMITLRWMIPGKTPEDLPLVTEKINEITTKKIGARVEFQYVDTGAYQEKMEGYMATAYEYDLAFGGAYNTLINAASKGGILSLDEMIQKHPKLKEAIPDYAWELTKYNGEIYGVPNLQVLPMVYAVSCEKRWLEKIGGFDPYSINKLDDIEPYFEAAMRYFEENGIENVVPFTPLKNRIGPIVFGYCDIYDKVDNVMFIKDDKGEWKGKIMWETPEFQRGVKRLYEWYKKGYIREDILEEKTNISQIVNLTIYKPGIETNYLGQGFSTSCQLVQKPVIEWCAAMTYIGKDSQNPELAMKLIELVNTDKELYNLITLGIEGVHYEKTGENTFRYIGSSNDNKYFVNAGWKFGNQFNEYIQEGADLTVWEDTMEYNDSAKLTPFAGFSINNENIREELEQIDEIVDSYPVIHLGAANPDDYYDEFLQKLKEAGADKVVAEYERQINEFMKEKLN